MSEVLFITPSLQQNIMDESVGTALLATILRQKGIRAEILQFSCFGNPDVFDVFLNSAAEKIIQTGAKIVSFYTRCDTYHIILRIALELKLRNSEISIVMGGPQADISAIDTIREIPYVDYICCGEGETTIYPFFSSLLRGQPDLSVPGLVYRLNGEVIQNPRPRLIEDLDSLPEVDYTLLNFKLPLNPSEAFPIDIGRGCPFGCTYCSTKTFWGRKYRLKSPQRIYSEISHLYAQFGVTYFAFEHDMFTMNRNKVLETCRLLQTLDFPVSWRCSARIDCLDRELIDIMANAGLKKIFIGIETGSPRMQKIINKNLKLGNVIEILRYIHSKGIELTTSFIYGFPEETEADLSQTLALITEIAKLESATIGTYLCTFLPGTELTQRYFPELTPAVRTTEISNSSAFAECADLIAAHPKVFVHLWEYQSELRSKLSHFSLFVRIWVLLQPVYQYFAEQYPADKLIDMYWDFCDANRSILDQSNSLSPSECIRAILKNDRFGKRFCDNPYADMIADYYRMVEIQYSDKLGSEGPVTDVFCFSPAELKRGIKLQDCQRKIAVVTFVKQADKTIKIRTRTMRNQHLSQRNSPERTSK